MKFIGNNATLQLLAYPNSWFSLENSISVSFTGLTVTVNTTNSLSYLIDLVFVSSVEMTNIKIECSNCSDPFFNLFGGTCNFKNLTIVVINIIDYNSFIMTLFENVIGLNISDSNFQYLGSEWVNVLAVASVYRWRSSEHC